MSSCGVIEHDHLGNGLPFVRRRAITRTNTDLLAIGRMGQILVKF